MKKTGLIIFAASIIILLILLLAVFQPVTVENRMFPFYLPWDDCEETIVSVSSRLRKPSGSLGHVYVGGDGHLYIDGERIKFLGINICGGAAFPEKDEAEKISARLAKFGVNAVRFHHMDASWESFNIFDKVSGGTRLLSRNALDKLDYFISKLKENGIYVDLNLLVSRRFTSADGLPREVESVDWKDQQILGFFIDEVEALEKEYAAQLLTHLNPYTGMTYCEDPAIAFIEIVNEQGLLHSWLGGVIDRLPEIFKEGLRAKWNSYLLSKYGSDEAFFKAWGAAGFVNHTEVLRNGCFENGLEYWNVEVHDGARASSTIVEDPEGKNSLKIEVLELGSANWHVQFNQPGLKVRSGEIYLISFRARAEKEVTVAVGFVQAHDPWRLLSQRIEVLLTPEWKDYEIALPISESDDNARFDVSGLAASRTTYQFSCFSAKRSEGYGAMVDESVEKATVRILTLADYWKRSQVVRSDWVEFLYSLEERFFTEMRRYIKEELNAKALVIGTIVGCSTPNIMSKLDIVDTHAYWNHPSFPGTPWDPSNWYVVNEPMVNNPQQSTIVGLAVKRVENKPHFVTEYNHPAPNMYDAETVLTLATYAALQDWDGIFLFDYGSRGDWGSRRLRGFFNIDQHPVKMATLIPAYFIFVRGDVRPAEKLVEVGLSKEDEIKLIESGKIYAWALPDAGHTGFNPLLSLIHRVAIVTNLSQATNDVMEEVSGPVYCADNGEVLWDVSNQGRGRILVNTSRSIAIIGFNGGSSLSFGNIVVKPGETLLDGWSVITISAMNGKNMTSGNRMLLIAAGYTTNTGMFLRTYDGGVNMLKWSGRSLADVKIYNEPVTCGTNWGSAPTLVEGVSTTIRIRTGMRLQVWALDNIGRRVKQVDVVDEGEYKVFSIGPEFQTLWYELEFSPT
jgi:hypothetical protein